MIRIKAGDKTTSSVAGIVKKVTTRASTRRDLASQMTATPISIQTSAMASMTTPSGIPSQSGG